MSRKRVEAGDILSIQGDDKDRRNMLAGVLASLFLQIAV